jgi:hypothetical protein
MKIAVGTAHLTGVNVPEKGVERGSNQGKSGENHACLLRRSSKIFVYHVRDLGGATSNVGRPKCLATTVWPWRPYISSAPADDFSSLDLDSSRVHVLLGTL